MVATDTQKTWNTLIVFDFFFFFHTWKYTWKIKLWSIYLRVKIWMNGCDVYFNYFYNSYLNVCCFWKIGKGEGGTS